MTITKQFLLGCMVHAVPSSARGCRTAVLIRLSLDPLACPRGTVSLPVPKQASDSPNQINRNSTSVSINTTHRSLTGSMCRRLSCSRCRKPWTSIVFVVCVFTVPVCMIKFCMRGFFALPHSIPPKAVQKYPFLFFPMYAIGTLLYTYTRQPAHPSEWPNCGRHMTASCYCTGMGGSR